MKNTSVIKLMATVTAAIYMSFTACSARSVLTNSNAEGSFNDVDSASWYYEDVQTAYSLGLVNGKGNSVFAPDGNVTVAEGITLAARIHAICHENEITQKSGESWYDMYVDYSRENGLLEDDTFANYDRNILRHEVAELFAKAMPEESFKSINDVKLIPDVSEKEEYFDELIKLYNAGIVMGSTEYGDFMPTSEITRCEIAAIITRAVLPERRVQKTLKDYGRRQQAVYLINDHTMQRTVRSVLSIASGWRYENTIDITVDAENKSINSLSDISNTGHAAMHRDITTVYDGVVELEALFTATSPGYKMVLSDINGNNMFTLECKADGSYYVYGDTVQKTDFAFSAAAVNAYFVFNLDERKAKIVIGGNDIGTFDMSGTAADISRLSFVTGDEELATLIVSKVFMYTNYVINDLFRTTSIGKKPYGWETSGNVTVETIQSDIDTNSVRIDGNGCASKTFDAVSEKFVYETYVKVPDGKELNINLKSGSSAVLSVKASDGKFTSSGSFLRDYTDTVWQLVRIEADTVNKTAVIKINNKKCLDVPFNADFIDSAEISALGNGYAWFDDVELYNVYDYADYCPEPVPVTDDNWYSGMSVCSLWREGTHYGWDCISPYDELTPLMGYYDEGLPEVADWEIKMLVEHGYDFQHFCWYAGSTADGIKEPRLSDALNNGYMNAKYSHMQDFMIMWENAGYSYTGFDFFKKHVWDYWCDWYFSDDRYFTIDNKPVITIYQYSKFINTFGSEEAAAEAIAFMKEDIKKLGFDGMIILFCSQGNNAATNKLFAELGGDAMMSYGFGENSYSPAYQITAMNTAFNNGHISLMPSVGVGFNDIGWTETRTPNATPEAHKEVLMWAKDDYMVRLDEREDEDWKSRLVISTTWNEFGEGHYIMPSKLNGFGYVDAARQVFSSVADTDDSTHFDIAPTINQKKRLGYLYPNRTQLIKRTYWIDNNINYDEMSVIRGWDFENSANTQMWITLMQISSLGYSEAEKALKGVSTGSDPAILLLPTASNYLNAEDIKYMKVRMKYGENTTSNSSVYFMTSNDTEYVEARGIAKSINSLDGEYKDYYYDLSANKYWQGTITKIRFDPCAFAGNFYIKSIEFLGDSADYDLALNVDGKTIKISDTFFKKADGEIFIAGDPTYGFYSLNNFYTEWNRHTGTLMIKTGTGHIFNFTAGSDSVLVDGASKKLPAALEVVDGLPMLPMKFIYDNAEISYEESENGLAVTIRNDDIYKEIQSRVENEFEFNIDSDNENWNIGVASGSVYGGYLQMTAQTASNGLYDPQITNTKVSMDASLYDRVEVRFKPVFANPDEKNQMACIYFATSAQPNLDEKKTSKLYLNGFTPDSDGFYTLTFNLAANELWQGKIMTVRFDPANNAGDYMIDYIRFLKDPDAEEKLKNEELKAQLRKENLSVADNGGPFFVENANAEDSSLEPLSTSYVFSVDELKEGNHAIEHIPNGSTKNWAYITIPTRFKPGVTYRIEMDVRVTKDHNGDDVENASLAWNLRYSDIVDGTFKTTADHHNGLGLFSTSDGWKHVTFTHTVSENSMIREFDYFATYANPQESSDGSYKVIGYMIDNITVTVVK